MKLRILAAALGVAVAQGAFAQSSSSPGTSPGLANDTSAGSSSAACDRLTGSSRESCIGELRRSTPAVQPGGVTGSGTLGGSGSVGGGSLGSSGSPGSSGSLGGSSSVGAGSPTSPSLGGPRPNSSLGAGGTSGSGALGSPGFTSGGASGSAGASGTAGGNISR